MFKVLICGGRDLYDFMSQEIAEELVNYTLSSLKTSPEKEETVFISGMAKGADQIPIRMIQNDPGWGGLEEYYAEWNKYGNRAGPLRNIRMLEEGKPDLVIAFPTPSSRGTHHMIKISQDAGVRTVVHYAE